MNFKEWKLKALTDIWTGDANRKGERLILTGLLGSIRWWFEVLVRGLDGKACDPTNPSVRCPDSRVKDPLKNGHHCVVCELFGCTGWARKFRLIVLDNQGQVIQKQIKKGEEFILKFIPLRPIRDEEWCLLDCTLRLIANYGAIGGKTVLKPSDESNRQEKIHHQDFGLIEIKYSSGLKDHCKDLESLKSYVRDDKWRKDFEDNKFSWASLKNFWFVEGHYLARIDKEKSTFNFVIGRKQSKGEAQSLVQDTPENRWLAGYRQESKKVFSFKKPDEKGRTFGFVEPVTLKP
ncbi:type III-B CRISPR module RAMP protein Cmr1, partial [Pseudothermotoga sp.]|uniref:type III-B CRISPR module RAMP protein Cmr1 n=1 Tax=Pseudothermotoga sp. TaxID=2033661 RepID=UPI0031F62160